MALEWQAEKTSSFGEEKQKTAHFEATCVILYHGKWGLNKSHPEPAKPARWEGTKHIS